MMKYLKEERLSDFLRLASTLRKVYVPVIDAGQRTSSYRLYESGLCEDSLAFSELLHTTRSAKDFFFPQTENLVEFRMSGKEITVLDPRRETEDFAIFGVRACDAKSFAILDSVYLADPVDTYYQNRRAHGLILTMMCTKPEETCFCGTFGIDPTEPGGDIAFYPIAQTPSNHPDGYALAAQTEKGAAFLAEVERLSGEACLGEAGLLEERDETPLEKAKEKTRETLKKLPLADVKPVGGGEGNLLSLFHSEKWASLSESCIGCGTCTFVCPTCQCYDIRDFDTGHGVRRFRCWDSCMYSDFTKMAHGNPRLTQLERFRQRFMHKLVYHPANHDGTYGCVGCGRCLSSCPVGMNIVKVMKALAAEVPSDAPNG